MNEKLRLVRQSKGWSQEDVAEKLNMSSNGYGDIERGATDVKLSRLIQLAELFGISLSELFDLEIPNAKPNINIAITNKQYHSSFRVTPAMEIECQKKIIEKLEQEIKYLKEIVDLLKESKEFKSFEK